MSLFILTPHVQVKHNLCVLCIEHNKVYFNINVITWSKIKITVIIIIMGKKDFDEFLDTCQSKDRV